MTPPREMTCYDPQDADLTPFDLARAVHRATVAVIALVGALVAVAVGFLGALAGWW